MTETTIIGATDSGVAVDDTYTEYTYNNTVMATKTVYLKVDYDSVQNPNAQTVTTYDFNLQGRMSKVTLQTYNGGTLLVSEEITEYKYDHKGNRVEARHTEDTNADSSLETDETTTYLNDPDNFTGFTQTIEETTVDNLDSATEIEKLIYTVGLDIIEQVKYNANNPSGLSSTFLYDAHGSTRILTDYLGAISIFNSVKQIFKYDAYGNAIGFTTTEALTKILYSGEMLDTRINWQYLRARFYNSATGNFNRLDPFFGKNRDPQSFHKYLYTNADPVNGIDPRGKTTYPEIAVVSAITAIVGSTVVGAATASIRAWEDDQSWEEIGWEAAKGAGWGFVAGAVIAAGILTYPVVGPTFQGILLAYGLSGAIAGIGIGLGSATDNYKNGRPISGTIDVGMSALGTLSLLKANQAATIGQLSETAATTGRTKPVNITWNNAVDIEPEQAISYVAIRNNPKYGLKSIKKLDGDILGKNAQGVEGIEYFHDGSEGHFSFKSFREVKQPGRLNNRIGENYDRIVAAGKENVTLYAEPVHFKAKKLLDFFENGPVKNKFLDGKVFTEMIFRAEDGILIMTPESSRIIK